MRKTKEEMNKTDEQRMEILTAAARKKPISGKDCPWLTIAGRAGTIEYAENVYDWMEHEFGIGHFCIVADEHWWYVEERREAKQQPSEDSARLDWLSERMTNVNSATCGEIFGWTKNGGQNAYELYKNIITLREAIDAAMKTKDLGRSRSSGDCFRNRTGFSCGNILHQ